MSPARRTWVYKSAGVGDPGNTPPMPTTATRVSSLRMDDPMTGSRLVAPESPSQARVDGTLASFHAGNPVAGAVHPIDVRNHQTTRFAIYSTNEPRDLGWKRQSDWSIVKRDTPY